MHNWAIVNRFTAQNFIILQILCYQKSRTVFVSRKRLISMSRGGDLWTLGL